MKRSLKIKNPVKSLGLVTMPKEIVMAVEMRLDGTTCLLVNKRHKSFSQEWMRHQGRQLFTVIGVMIQGGKDGQFAAMIKRSVRAEKEAE